MKFTVRTKLIALTTLVVTLTMANVTYFFTLRQLKDKRSDVESQMVRIARNIATLQLIERQNWRDYQNYISQLMEFNDDIVYIAIYDDRDLLRAHALNTALVEIEQTGLQSRRAQAEFVRKLDAGLVAAESRRDLRTQEVNIQSGDRVLGSVHVGFSLIEINNELQSRILRNVGVAIMLIVFGSVLALLLGRRITAPLERLSHAMAAIAKGKFDQKVNVENRDEIGQLAETFNEMVEGLRERNIIERLGQEMSKSFELMPLIDVVQNRLSSAIKADGARILLQDKNDPDCLDELESGSRQQANHFHLDARTRAFLMGQLEGFTFAASPKYVRERFDHGELRSQDLLIPMVVKEHLLGVLVFCLKDGAPIKDERRQFAVTLATQAALALENALLYDDLREQDRLKRELEIAREVQHKLLPSQMPKISGFQFDGICLSAHEVGGDYFDFFPIENDRVGIVIADVSGKGTSASFYMAEIKGMMSSLVLHNYSPKELLSILNTGLYKSLDRRMFATMIYGILDARTRRFTFARAGHNSLFHARHQQAVDVFTPAGIGLGLDSGRVFDEALEESEIVLTHGDSVLLFTDGITESMNGASEEFGEERLKTLVCNNGDRDAIGLRERIFSDVESFVNGAQQHDDLTMVVIHCE